MPRRFSGEGQLAITRDGTGPRHFTGDSRRQCGRVEHRDDVADDIAATVKVVKPSVAVPPWPDQWDTLVSQATVAVTGFGGCGSCSTRSMRDALDLEAAGIPAVCIVHRALVPAVEALCRLVGAPGYPFVVVDYPYNPTGVWSEDEASAMAEQVLDAVRARLTA